MLGTNKKTQTLRLSTDRTAYESCLSTFQSRYEPMKYTNYNLRAKQISFKFMCDLMDIKVSDRIIHDEREFVVAGVAKFTEVLGKHLEIVMRELGPTSVHETVTRKVLDEVQSGYDPLLEEWSYASKIYKTNDLLVLLDPREIAKESIIKMMDAGKIEELDYVMTVDLPEKIAKEDRVIYNGVEYEIKRVLPQPYQYQVGLKKSMVNYMDNQN